MVRNRIGAAKESDGVRSSVDRRLGPIQPAVIELSLSRMIGKSFDTLMAHSKSHVASLICLLVVLLALPAAGRAAEPNWFPLDAVTADGAAAIVDTFIRGPHLYTDREMADIAKAQPAEPVRWTSAGKPGYVSMWEKPIRVAVFAAPTGGFTGEQIVADVVSLTSFMLDGSPTPISFVPVQDADQSMMPNVFVMYSNQFGDRDPYLENPLHPFVHIESSAYPRICGLICRSERMDRPAEQSVAVSTVAESPETPTARRGDEHVERCCRLVETDQSIVGGLFYENKPFPISLSAGAVPSYAEYAGCIRRILETLTVAIGAHRGSVPTGDRPRELVSPVEDAVQRHSPADNPTYSEDRDAYLPDGEWADISRKLAVCALPRLPAGQEAERDLGREPVDISASCLALHRTVAAWRLLRAAGVRSGMTREAAVEDLLMYAANNTKR